MKGRTRRQLEGDPRSDRADEIDEIINACEAAARAS